MQLSELFYEFACVYLVLKEEGDFARIDPLLFLEFVLKHWQPAYFNLLARSFAFKDARLNHSEISAKQLQPTIKFL